MANDDTTVTIDGPAGSGKTTVAERLARRLGYRFLDTGAMYRAATLAAIRAGVAQPLGAGESAVPKLDEAAVVVAVERAGIELLDDGAVVLGGTIVGQDIRTDAVTSLVSAVSALRGVREAMTSRQREFGRRARPGLVAEGRDMASVVFPRSRHRFYLEASLDVRASRRLKQMREKHDAALREGKVPELVPALDEVRTKLDARDAADSAREEAPLRKVPGVACVDTDALDVDGVVAALEKAVAVARHA